MKQYLPHGVLNVVNNCDSSDIGEVQNPLFASILESFLTPLMLELISWKVHELCTLNLSALLIVLGSRQTHSLPLGFLTRTKLCTQ